MRPKEIQWPKVRAASVTTPLIRPMIRAGQHQAPISAGMLKMSERKETILERVRGGRRQSIQRAGLVLSDLLWANEAGMRKTYDGLDFGLLAGSLTVSASISVGDCGDRDVCAFGGGFLEQRGLNHERTSPGSRSLLEKRRAHHERAGSRLRGHFGRKKI